MGFSAAGAAATSATVVSADAATTAALVAASETAATAAATTSISTVAAYASLASAAAGTLTSAIGAEQQGAASANAAKYQAQVAVNNQALSAQAASDALTQGNLAEQNARQATANRLGGVRAAEAASGTDITSGSDLAVQSDTEKLGTLDALTIRNSAARAAYGYQIQGQSFGGEAALSEAKAADANIAGNIGVASSILGGASSVSSKWAQYQRAGIITSQDGF